MPELGHLYHDSSISNSSVILDAKEYLKTREINAREQRHLGQLSKYLDRAKTASEKVKNHEKWCVRESLRALHIKTPTIEKGLQRETERLRRMRERYQEELSPVSNGVHGSRVPSGYSRSASDFMFMPYSERSSRLSRLNPSIFPKLSSPAVAVTSPGSVYHSTTLPSRQRFSSSSCKADRKFYLKKAVPVGKPKPQNSGANFVRRADHVVKSLHRLYRRFIEREEKQRGKHIFDVLDPSSQGILDRARMVLGHEATNEMIALFSNIVNDSQSEEDNLDMLSVFSEIHNGDGNAADTDRVIGDRDTTGTRVPSLDTQSAGNIIGEDKDVESYVALGKNIPRPDKSSGRVTFSRKTNSSNKDEQRAKGFCKRADSMANIMNMLHSKVLMGHRGQGEGLAKGGTQLSLSRALWQQQSGNVHRDSPKSPKATSVVTLTGKYRRSMLNR